MRKRHQSDTETHVERLMAADTGNFDATLLFVVLGLPALIYASLGMIDPWVAVFHHQATFEVKTAFLPVAWKLFFSGVPLLWAAWSLKKTAKRHAGRSGAISLRLRQPGLDRWSSLLRVLFRKRHKTQILRTMGGDEGKFDATLFYVVLGSGGLIYFSLGMIDPWVAVFHHQVTPEVKAAFSMFAGQFFLSGVPLLWGAWSLKQTARRHGVRNARVVKSPQRPSLDRWSTLLNVLMRKHH